MKKDWTGNKKSVYANLGASSHAEGERAELDYYATEPKALKLLLEIEHFNKNIWECACGENHLSDVLGDNDYNVKASDIVRRCDNMEVIDFLNSGIDSFDGDIITNPPYKYAQQFIEKALEIIPVGNRVAMFLKVQFLETKGRRELFRRDPPAKIYVSSNRLMCAKNGDFKGLIKSGGSAVAYSWFIWEKGFKGDPVIKWFN